MIAVSLYSFSALRAQESAPAAPAMAASDAPSDASSADSIPGSDYVLPSDASPPPAEMAPPTTPGEAEAQDQTLYDADQALSDTPAEPPAQGRSWKLNLHTSAASRYDDNIFISSTDKRHDFLSILAAGGGITLGDYTARENNYLISDYTGTEEIFGRYGSQDAYEQSALIEAQALLAHLTLRGNFQFADLADEDIDVGTRARRQLYTGNGSARYDLSDKAYLEATTQVTIAHYDLYLGSNDERGGLSFNYRPNPDVTLGLGVMGGVLNVQDSGAQTYEQLLSSLQIAATGKFTLLASAGVEDRQTADNGGFITPICEITGDYKPFEAIELTLTAYRHVVNSAYYAGSDYVATGVSAGIRDQFSARFGFLLEGGYANADYREIAAGTSPSRSDNYFSIRPALTYTASTYCKLELYYFYRDNHSTVATSGFNDTQVGVSINLTY